MKKTAWISQCGLYRYRLTRHWGPGHRVLCFVMLNPSTADAEEDDPTVRLCISWAKLLGFDGLVVVNLFALRSTDPSKLKVVADPVGPENDDIILDSAIASSMILCAWGNHGGIGRRSEFVKSMLSRAGIKLHCLKLSKKLQPVHPLYQPYSLVPFPMEDYKTHEAV